MENNTISVNLNNLTEEEREQFFKLVEKSNSKKGKVWNPEKGTKFYSVTPIGEIFNNCYNCKDDYKYFQLGNAFKTEEEAKFAIEKQKLITEIKRYITENDPRELDWTNPRQLKFSIYYNSGTDEIYKTGNVHFHRCPDGIFFSNDFDYKTMIEDIGEDRIKKYLFGVK